MIRNQFLLILLHRPTFRKENRRDNQLHVQNSSIKLLFNCTYVFTMIKMNASGLVLKVLLELLLCIERR